MLDELLEYTQDGESSQSGPSLVWFHMTRHLQSGGMCFLFPVGSEFWVEEAMASGNQPLVERPLFATNSKPAGLVPGCLLRYTLSPCHRPVLCQKRGGGMQITAKFKTARYIPDFWQKLDGVPSANISSMYLGKAKNT